jgi:hypothetical protein
LKPVKEIGVMNMRLSIRSFCFIFFIVSIGQIGCSHTPDRPKVLSDDFRVNFGTIGVVSTRFEPNIFLRIPMDKSAAAWSGAKTYGSSWVRLGGTDKGAILMLLTAPIAMGAGAIVGGSKGLSDEKMKEVTAAEASIRATITDLRIQDNFQDYFLETAHTFPFIRVDAEGPISLEEKVSYRSLAGKGMDSILEISVTAINLEGLGGKPDFSLSYLDSPLWVSLNVRVRLVRIMDDTEIFTQFFTTKCYGQRFKFLEWGANDAQRFQEEVTYCYSSVRKRIVRGLLNPFCDLTGYWTFLMQSCSEYLTSLCQISGTFFLQNTGNLDAPASSIKFYLSEGPEFDEGRSTLLKEVPTKMLRVRKVQPIWFRYDLDKGQEVRGKYIIAIIGEERKRAESDTEDHYVVEIIK